MPTFTEPRLAMVEEQVQRRGVSDERVLDAMRLVPRELFVADSKREDAYSDRPLGIAERQTISQPYMVGLMTELLELEDTSRVLEIGTGSGYAAAILAQIARRVYTIERHKKLVKLAQARLSKLDYDNIEVFHGDGTKGLKQEAPFDAIVVTAGGPSVPESLKYQLAVGGRLLIPVGDRETQRLVRVTRVDRDSFKEESLNVVRFVPLIGEQGWSDASSVSDF